MSGAVPELRFPGFAGEWKKSNAGAAFSKGTAKGNANLPIYSVTMDRGLVPRDSLDRHMVDDAADGSNLRAEPGDIVYNTMRMWQGAAGVAKEACMVSPAYVVLRPKSGTVSDFFNQRFTNRKMLHSLWAYSHGLTSDRLRLYFNDFAKIPVRIPHPSEQQKIADFLGTVDAKLDALRRKKSGLEAFKSGLMQRLFSQVIRFNRDEGTDFPDWEVMRLGDFLAPFRQRVGALTDIPVFSSSREGLLPQRDYFADREVSNEGEYGVVPDGCVTYRHMSDDLTFKFNLNNLGYSVAVSKEYPVFTVCDMDSRFLLYWLNNSREFAEFAAAQKKGGTRTRLYFSVLQELRLRAPLFDEQRKIADTLSALDAKIAAVSDQITHMETFKKGLLQQMFV